MLSVPITYRYIRLEERKLVCALVLRSFNEFVAPGFTQEGIALFTQSVTPAEIDNQEIIVRQFILVAMNGLTIAGVIAMRLEKHITWLFVDQQYQRQGIAKELVKKAIEICHQRNHAVEAITVNASLYSISCYKAMGFIETGPDADYKGIKYRPMKKYVV